MKKIFFGFFILVVFSVNAQNSQSLLFQQNHSTIKLQTPSSGRLGKMFDSLNYSLVNILNPVLVGTSTSGYGWIATDAFGHGHWAPISGGGGSGLTTIATANGFAGSGSPTSTLSTTVTGMIKGNGTALLAAVSGTDYVSSTSNAGLIYYNVLNYGAVGDGTTDNATAFAAVVTAINASTSKSGKVIIPAGVYLFNSSITIPSGVTIWWEGSGSTNEYNIGPITQLTTTSTTSDLFNDGANGSTYSNFDIKNISSCTDGAAIHSSGVSLQMQNMLIWGFYYGLKQDLSQNSIVHNVHFDDQVFQCIANQNTANPDIGDMRISDCYFTANTAGRNPTAIFNLGSGGLKITNCKFNSYLGLLNNCIEQSFPSSSYQTTDLLISNNSFENFQGTAIKVTVGTGGKFGNVVIGNNQIAGILGNGSAITMTNSGGTFSHITISGVAITDCSNGITLTGVNDIHMSAISNNATTKTAYTSCTNLFYDRDNATVAQAGLMSAIDKTEYETLKTAFGSSTTVPGSGAVIISDQFNRSNTTNIATSTPSPTNTPLGSWFDMYTGSGVTLGILSNQLYCSASGNGASIITTATSNYDVTVTLINPSVNTGGSFGLMALTTNQNSYIGGFISPGNAVSIYTIIGGAYTPIFSGTHSFTAGDTFTLRVIDGIASIYGNTTLIGSGFYDPTSFSGNSAGVQSNGNTLTVADNFLVSSAVVSWGINIGSGLSGIGTPSNPLVVTGGLSAGTNGTDANYTAVANTYIHLPIATLTANRNFLIPTATNGNTLIVKNNEIAFSWLLTGPSVYYGDDSTILTQFFANTTYELIVIDGHWTIKN